MILEKILLGITLAAPIGPVSIEMIKRGLEKGFWAAFKVRLGGAIGNTLCLIISYFSLSAIINKPVITSSIGLVGALYLVIMGFKNLTKKTVSLSGAQNKFLSKIENSGLLVGFILSLANPVSIVFWLSIFASTFSAEEAGLVNFALDLLIICGVLIWGIILSLALALGNAILSENNILIVTRIAGAFLLYFGLRYSLLNAEKIFSIIN